MRNAKRGMDIAFHLICELNFHRIGQINFVIQILSFEFLQDEYIDLNVKEVKSIQIAIMDATGNSVKTDNSTPTRLQLMFSTV